jgi:hypothetical protein
MSRIRNTGVLNVKIPLAPLPGRLACSVATVGRPPPAISSCSARAASLWTGRQRDAQLSGQSVAPPPYCCPPLPPPCPGLRGKQNTVARRKCMGGEGLKENLLGKQCCGSGMFNSGSQIRNFLSWIPDTGSKRSRIRIRIKELNYF